MYRNRENCHEMVGVLVSVFVDELVTKMRSSSFVSVSVDESTDISVEKHLIMYITTENEGNKETNFLVI